MKTQNFRNFTEVENSTWRELFNNLSENRKLQAVSMFQEGLDFLGITEERIPSINEVNRRLEVRTGWKGVPVEGLEAGRSFYSALAHCLYPIGNFIRGAKEGQYTPAPDIFHDLYGHIPFFVNPAYADFNCKYGKLVVRAATDSKKLTCYERFYWFTVEFGLLETPKGRRIFGAGLLSSKGESQYSMSAQPEVRPFNIKNIIQQEYKIDEFQKVLFLLKSEKQLYESLDELEETIDGMEA